MSELMHRMVDPRQEKEKAFAARIQAAQAMSPEQARALEAESAAKPTDVELRTKLLWYYDKHWDPPARRRHVLWMIENKSADDRLFYTIDPKYDQSGFGRGKALWLAKTRTSGASPRMFSRAAEFIRAGDQFEAERILQAGQKAHPGERFAHQLGSLYADAAVGGRGPLVYGVLREVSAAEADGEFARHARRQLDTTTDPDLLTAAAQRLLVHGSQWRKQIRFDPVELAAAYLARAQRQRPDDRAGIEIRARLEKWRRRQRLEDLLQSRKKLDDVLPNATPEDRALLLPVGIQGAMFRNQLDKAERYANGILELRDAPLDEVFRAKMTLGKIALRRGQKRAAVRYMLEAARLPSLDREPYLEVSMELPRSLVDWGERSAVAEFLELCAKRNPVKAATWIDWAAQIRRGINPDLIPFQSGCANDPC